MKGNIAQRNWLYDAHVLKTGGSMTSYLFYYATQHKKSTQQPRTAFSYKTPAQERFAGNATSTPRPIKKRLDTSEAPTTER